MLVQMGFTLNPYDKYVANKMVNGKQMTIVWYVEDCKVSHVNPGEVTNLENESTLSCRQDRQKIDKIYKENQRKAH